MAAGRIRVEVQTPGGREHVAEEVLTPSLVDLMAKTKREPTAKNRLRLLDALVERGTRLVLSVSAAVSRGFRKRAKPAN
jgi:hypothetical protein